MVCYGHAKLLYLLAESRQHFHVALATFDLLVENHAVEPFSAFAQFLRQIEVGAGGEAEPIDVLLHHVLGFFDSLGDFNLLLSCQQRHLAHLLEIHPDWIIQNIELCLWLFLLLFFFRLFLSVLVTIDFRGFDDIDLHSP